MENMRPEAVAIASLENLTLEEICCVMHEHAVAQLKAEREIPKTVEEYDMIVAGEDEFIKRLRKQSSLLEIVYLRAKTAVVHEMDREELMALEEEQEAQEMQVQQEELDKSNEVTGLSELERRLMEILRRA